ncbi:MAG: hypothetical protein ACKV2Q_29395 [Planctomycetaceae bacterium]
MAPQNVVLAKPLKYSEVRQRMQRHYLRQAEVPAEHEVSLPWPTLQSGRPAFAFFASPAARQPGLPLRQWPPDRWWIVDGVSGQLLKYNLCQIEPLVSETEWSVVDVPAPASSVAAVRQLLVDIEQLSDDLAAAFFRGEPADPALRESLVNILRHMFPAMILDQCRAVAPDYCRWLQCLEAEDGQ